MVPLLKACKIQTRTSNGLPHSNTWTTGRRLQLPNNGCSHLRRRWGCESQHDLPFSLHQYRLTQRRSVPKRTVACPIIAQDQRHQGASPGVSWGQPAAVAGIPVIGTDATQQGQALWTCLQQHPAGFVQLARQQLQDLALQQRSRASDEEASTVHERLSQARQDLVREDIMYYWALAEAYLQDPALQQPMRDALGRSGCKPLASGSDNTVLRSRVQLLENRDGIYMIGACRFEAQQPQDEDNERQLPSDSGNGSSDSQESPPGQPSGRQRPRQPRERGIAPGIQWGGVESDAELGVPPPSLEAVFASGVAKAAMALEGGTPSRLNREGAARTYHMYCYWGYMNRRMARLRAQEPPASGTGQYAFGEAGGSQQSSYGSMTNVWRYFENVPDEICSLRTPTAAAVADRHLRALFGDQEECITTLLAWQQMCLEARWFGRALYDAEEFVLQCSGIHL